MRLFTRPMILGTLLVVAGAVHADCTYPKGPSDIPNGGSATQQEMVAAMTAFKTYDAEVKAYGQCLEQETSSKIKQGGDTMSPVTIRELKLIQSKKNNTAVEELQAKVKQFNDQVRLFKSKNS